jgi:cell division protein FtsI (penicillin-binding protein 3)
MTPPGVRGGRSARGKQPAAPRRRGQFNLRARLGLVGGTLALCSLALVVRAVDLQLVDGAFYRQQGDARFLRELPIPVSRGMITDRHGEPVAVSSPVESVWGNPQELLKAPHRLPELAEALGIPHEHLVRKLGQRADKEFVYLKRRMNPAAARRILALEIPGVSSQREFRRFYPQGEAMAHVLGFTNIDDQGQEGLELAFDEWLRGTPGRKKVIRDRRGRIVENVDLLASPEPGRDLVLSIDRRIQYLAYRELKEALLEHSASSGSAVVLDVETGEVLAMANLPSYNPNSVDGRDRDSRRNRAVTDVVEPGSTMKPFTVAAALDAGVVTAGTPIETSPGYIRIGRFAPRDLRNYGLLDVTGVITKSSNVGSIKIAQKLPDAAFHGYLHAVGYGRSTGSGFPGESSGVLPDPGNWSGSSKATISYGYGLSATPLQLAQAYAALGNGGRRIAPTFVKGQSGEAEQVIDPQVAAEVVRMMETVTLAGGTATRAAILGYRVAGKTGTSRQASGGGYSRRYSSLFAGLVPASNPRFAMVVLINEPDASKGYGYGGGAVAAPVFHDVMAGALRLMDVAPDDLDTWLAAQAKAEAERARRAAPTAMPAAPAAPAILPEAATAADAAMLLPEAPR